MKKSFIFLSMAVLALVACQEKKDRPSGKDDPTPIVPEEQKLDGAGNLEYIDVDTHDKVTTKSTYKWSATEENGIQVEVNVDTKEYIEGDETTGVPGGAFEIGTLQLPLADLGEFLGVSVTETLNPDNFYPVCTYVEGASGWTSYMPGMWLNNAGEGCGWSEGNMFWQWYIWGGKTFHIGDSDVTVGYDLSDDGNYDNFKGLLFLGGNPTNTKKSGGKTIKSHNIIKLGKEINFDVTVKFGPYEAPTDDSAAVADKQGESILKGLQDSKEEIEGTKLTWDINSTAINFEATLSMSALEMTLAEGSETEYVGGPWAVGCVKFDLSIFTDVIGMDITTATLESFYPCDASGVAFTNDDGNHYWTSYVPGQWFNVDGTPGSWSSSPCYWWFASMAGSDGEIKTYEGEPAGAFVIGNGPSGVHTAGMVCKSYNKLNGVDFIVTIKFVE